MCHHSTPGRDQEPGSGTQQLGPRYEARTWLPGRRDMAPTTESFPLNPNLPVPAPTDGHREESLASDSPTLAGACGAAERGKLNPL